jgi:hypothetical protein
MVLWSGFVFGFCPLLVYGVNRFDDQSSFDNIGLEAPLFVEIFWLIFTCDHVPIHHVKAVEALYGSTCG